MHVILGDSIDGGIFALLIMCGGGAASLLALAAIFPARQGNKPVTLCMIAPAIVMGLVVTVWLGYGFFTDGLHNRDPEYVPDLMDFFAPWIILAGPALATSLISACVLWSKCRQMKLSA